MVDRPLPLPVRTLSAIGLAAASWAVVIVAAMLIAKVL